MRRHRPHVLLTALCCVCPCRGWTPAALARVLPRPATAGASSTVTCSRRAWGGPGKARCGRSTPRQTTTTAVAATSARDPWGREGPGGIGEPEGLGGFGGLGGPEDPEDETQAKKPLPRVKMDDTPIPEYLIDMLKEAGEIDENGKPLNDFFDPDDDDTFGSKRMKEHNAEVETDYYDVPFGEMLFGGKDEDKEDTGSLMDTSINNAVIEYGFPAEFFLDTLCRWGVTPPINQDGRLGDMIDAEQAAGLCEALTGLDGSDVRDNYLDESLEDLAYELEIPLPDLFQACAVQKINLPLGGDTHITVDEYKVLLDSVVEGGEKSRVRKLFDTSRKSHRWSGQKESETRDLAQEESDRVVEKNNAGFGWRDGPPTLGDGEGELPLGMAHISGRIFGEDIFASVSAEEEVEEDEDEEGAFAFFDHDAEEGGA